MKHRDKLRLARRMRRQDELLDGIPPFQSNALRVRKTMKRIRAEKLERKEENYE